MAKRSGALVAGWLWPGLIASTFIIVIAITALLTLVIYSPVELSFKSVLTELYHDAYLWHVISFTFKQAFLSALLSVLPAILVALALDRRHFTGRKLMLRLYAMSLVLPVLVAIFGLLTVYGQQGWLAHLCQLIGIDYTLTIYGLPGILLAHVFFNLPLASRLMLQALESIAPEQRQLAAQLGMTPWQRFQFVEWPVLKRQLAPTSALIFMLCFASFATVLTLGGGPKTTTIELGIYQALHFDFDLNSAALLALIQLLCCLAIMLFSLTINASLPMSASLNHRWRDRQDSRTLKLFDMVIILVALLLILPPLAAVIIDGINASLLTLLQQPKLWSAILTSVQIAAGSALISVILTMMILSSSRQLDATGHRLWAKQLELAGMTILAMPAIVLATGFFILLVNTIGLPESPLTLIMLINGLMAIPYTLKVLTQPMYQLNQRYQLICQSLAISGWNRLYWIDLKALKKPLGQALAFACVLSLGDFGAIALFGNEHFATLPFYLYQQLGAYRNQDGAVTALLLLVICFTLFTLIEKLSSQHDQS